MELFTLGSDLGKTPFAFYVSAKHSGNVTDGVPVADEGFSSCINCARSANSWNLWPRLRFARAGSRTQPPAFQVLPAGFLGSRPAWAMGNLLTPFAQERACCYAARWCTAGSCSLVWLTSNTLLSEVYSTWMVTGSLVIVAVAVLAGPLSSLTAVMA
jgi:hypothetical protein